MLQNLAWQKFFNLGSDQQPILLNIPKAGDISLLLLQTFLKLSGSVLAKLLNCNWMFSQRNLRRLMLTMQIEVFGEMTLTAARQHIQAARYRFIVLAPCHQTKKQLMDSIRTTKPSHPVSKNLTRNCDQNSQREEKYVAKISPDYFHSPEFD